MLPCFNACPLSPPQIPTFVVRRCSVWVGVMVLGLLFIHCTYAQDGMLGVVEPTAVEANRVVSWDDPFGGNHFMMSVGFRRDEFNWHIADGDGSPNILSELTWSGMGIAQLQFGGEMHLGQLVLMGELGTGIVRRGVTFDSDYLGDNRTAEFSRSSSDSGGDVLDGSIGVGLPFMFFYSDASGAAVLTPMVGLAANYQNLVMKNGVQIIPPQGPFPGLNSSYDARWEGPWIGARGEFYNAQRLLTRFQWEYHLGVNYEAVADWNLRTDPVTGFAHPISFRHLADAEGHRVLMSVRYLAQTRTEVYFGVDGHWYYTDNGTDITYFPNGTSSRQQLNRAKWDSVSMNFGVTFRF